MYGVNSISAATSNPLCTWRCTYFSNNVTNANKIQAHTSRETKQTHFNWMQCVGRGNHRSNSELNRTSARRGVWCFRSASQMVEEKRIKALEASPWSDVSPCGVEEDNRISIMRKRLYWGMLVLSIQSVWLNSKKEKKSHYGAKKKKCTGGIVKQNLILIVFASLSSCFEIK